MVVWYQGFISYFKKTKDSTKFKNIVAVLCVIHRYYVVAKFVSVRLHFSLQYVITIVNKLSSNSLKDRLFEKLCGENDLYFIRLLLHTEIFWSFNGIWRKYFLALLLHFIKTKVIR